jgi:ketosteroid isomerase-like protein
MLQYSTSIKREPMTPRELVLSGHQAFSEGDLGSLAQVFHKNAIIRINGDHKYSREYRGFDNWETIP